MNPASELLAIFDKWNEAPGVAQNQVQLDSPSDMGEMVRAFHLVMEIRDAINFLAETQQMTVYQETWPSWFKSVCHYPRSWSGERIDLAEANLLRALVPLLTQKGYERKMENIDESGISSLLDEIEALLIEDQSLDAYLSQYVSEHIIHVRVVLSRYKTTGMFDLARALKELQIIVASAEAMSESEESARHWQKIWQSFKDFLAAPMTNTLVSAGIGAGTALLTSV